MQRLPGVHPKRKKAGGGIATSPFRAHPTPSMAWLQIGLAALTERAPPDL